MKIISKGEGLSIASPWCIIIYHGCELCECLVSKNVWGLSDYGGYTQSHSCNPINYLRN